MKMELAIREYLKDIEIRQYTPKTIRNYTVNLRILFLFSQNEGVIDTEDITPALIKSYVAFLSSKGHKGSYINGLLKVAKSFIQYCYNEDYGAFNTKNRFSWVKEEKPVILTFKPEEVKDVMKACKGNDFLSLRDRCILTMFFETGIRAYELCCIKKEDIHNDFILIRGKNHKQRCAPISPILSKAMIKYEVARDNRFPFPKTDYYFVSFHDNQLTNSAVEHVCKKYSNGMSPHKFRHFFAQHQLKMGVDIYTISRLLGHESVAITQIYLRSLREEDIVSEAKNRSVLGSL